MKKIILSLVGLFLTIASMAQPTFVSTQPSNKNVVIEEFTGTNCTWCPAGHKIVNAISTANPGRIVAINIHQGGFSGNNPDYKTEWGNALANQYSIASYPNGTLNRGSGPVNYTTWPTAVTPILAQQSIVNVAARAQIDAETRLLTVTVEVYYTADAETSTNKLNVAILQNEVIGPQSGMDKNPDYVVGTQYRHMHMLRHLITGQWGDLLSVETSGVIPAGTFFTKTYTYTLPDAIRNVPLEFENIEIAAFVAKDNKTIYNGTLCHPTFNVTNQFGAEIKSYELKDLSGCSKYVGQTLKVRNIGQDTIKSMVIDTRVFGLSNITNWEGEIATFQTADIPNLPVLELQNGIQNEVDVLIRSINGIPTDLREIRTFKKPDPARNGLTLNLTLDQYGTETTWNIKNSSGSIVKSGGPYTNGTTDRLKVVDLTITENDCYTFTINDQYGDGINSGYGVGGYYILDGQGDTIVVSDGKFGASEVKKIGYGDYIGLEEVSQNDVSINVYPNPAKDNATIDITLSQNSVATIKVVDLMGRNVIDLGTKSMKAGQNTIELNTSNLNNGMYFVKVASENGVVTKKITINR
ncbi:MAG: Omp28-related outer membrane protein [Bacteroidales bacterium]|nr:Omp28-related outer membrane protein [Bacteroidales bacterium]